MSDVKVVDARGVVHLHRIGSSNNNKCRMSVYVPGSHRGPIRTARPVMCLWCVAGKRFR
jgi:hypothetical protein